MTSISESTFTATTKNNTITSWIPMKTGWRMPTECASLYHYNLFPFDGPKLVAYDPSWGVDIDTSISCQPPAVSTWFLQDSSTSTQSGSQSLTTSFSLKPMSCPDGYSEAEIKPVDASTSSVMCCPSGYSSYSDNNAQGIDCASDISSQATFTYQSYETLTTGSSSGMHDTSSWKDATTTYTESAYIGAMAIRGYSIATATKPGVGISSSTEVGHVNPGGSSSNNSSSADSSGSSDSSSGGLSSGVKTTIGVTVGIGSAAIIAIAVVICFMRRAKKKTKASTEESVAETEQPKGSSPAELHGQATLSELGGKVDAPELPGSDKHPQPGDATYPAELTGSHKRPPTELPGRWSPAEME